MVVPPRCGARVGYCQVMTRFSLTEKRVFFCLHFPFHSLVAKQIGARQFVTGNLLTLGFQSMADFDYDSIPTGYYDRIFHEARGPRGKWHDLKFKRVRDEMGGYAQHLDIGCGPGTFIGTLPNERPSIGIDISPTQIGYANAKYGHGNHAFQVCNSKSLPFSDAFFDCVTCVEVIEHLPYDLSKAVFKEAFRVLKPQGRLLVTTPNYRSAWPLLEKVVNSLSTVSYEEQHITLYEKSLLCKLLNEAGFQQITVEAFQSFAFLSAMIDYDFADKVANVFDRMPEYFSGMLILGIAKK